MNDKFQGSVLGIHRIVVEPLDGAEIFRTAVEFTLYPEKVNSPADSVSQELSDVFR